MLRLCWPAVVLLLAACAGAGAPAYPASAAGSYRLDYSGVYGVGRVDLELNDGKVTGLNPAAGAITYRGFYRTAKDGRMIALDLIAHLPPLHQQVQNAAVVTTARDFLVQLTLPADLAPGAAWPVTIETQHGPVTGRLTRLVAP